MVWFLYYDSRSWLLTKHFLLALISFFLSLHTGDVMLLGAAWPLDSTSVRGLKSMTIVSTGQWGATGDGLSYGRETWLGVINPERKGKRENELEIIRMCHTWVVYEYTIKSCPLDIKAHGASFFTKRIIERALVCNLFLMDRFIVFEKL